MARPGRQKPRLQPMLQIVHPFVDGKRETSSTSQPFILVCRRKIVLSLDVYPPQKAPPMDGWLIEDEQKTEMHGMRAYRTLARILHDLEKCIAAKNESYDR